ncbi:MAG: general secretion pathway protein GspB [Pseudomonadota bacterium]
MSLILDALNRAEREKRSANPQVADLLAPEAASSIEPERTISSATLIALALLLTSVVLGAFLLRSIFSGDGTEMRLEQSAPASQNAAEPRIAVSTDSGTERLVQGGEKRGAPEVEVPTDVSPKTRDESRQMLAANASQRVQPIERNELSKAGQPDSAEVAVVIEPVVGDQGRRVADLYSQAQRQRQQRAERSAVAAGPLSQALAASARAGDTTTAQRKDRDPGEERPGKAEDRTLKASSLYEESEEEAVDLVQALSQLQANRQTQALTPHPTPMLLSQSKQFKDSVPTLLYQQHDFNPVGVSTVTINGQVLRERQRTRGVEVREILVDSVVLRFSETEFRLRALNSWVNL